MAGIFKKFSLLGILSVSLLGGFAAQENPAADSHSTGLIPLDAKQVNEIVKSWPRINKTNFNWLGFERVNKIKAKKGKTPLDFSFIKPVGQEVESSIRKPGASMQSIVLNTDLIGDLPPIVDNSELKYFPPIRSQGSIGSCVSFASTYTQLSYMTAFQRDLDIRDNNDNTNKYSPKWTYNMINGGSDSGSYFSDNFKLLEGHGACTWAEFPYDSNYLSWCLNTAAWRNALNVRTNPTQYVYNASSDSGLELVKELVTNGYILVFGTYISSWQAKTIQNDPSTPDDDPEVGKYVGYWLNGTAGAHAMTLVGYNDAIWTDINGNSIIDTGEKGAFLIANSWGDDWADGGFIWLAYDALKSVSSVPDGPSAGRVAAFQGDMAFVMTVRNDYSPLMIAEYTVNHAKRNQLELNLGYSNLSSTIPTTVWTPWAIQNQGGAYAFDGSSTAIDGTFVFDFTDILLEAGGALRYYLGMNDNSAGDIATMIAYKIIDLTTEPDTEVESLNGSQTIDNGQAYAYVDYMYSGPAYNHPPSLAGGQVIPTNGTTLETYSFYIDYEDQDGDVPSVKNIVIDGIAHAMTLYSGTAANGWYYFGTGLSAGSHEFYFHFEDGAGESARFPIVGTMAGPIVVVPHIVTQPNIPSGETHPALGSTYAYSMSGSSCDQGHDIQYQFDWGDGTTSNWLPVGQASAQHTWNSTGVFGVKAQARCAVDTAVVSTWSNSLTVSISASIPFTEAFMPPASGWVQQNIGSGIGSLWSYNASNHAGGSPNEVRCSWDYANPGTTRLVTPPLDTTGFSNLRLRFKHFLDAWGTGCVLKVQTSPDRSTWTDETWSVETTSSDIGPETVDTILAHNLSISTTYVAFVITGDLYQYDFWYIDDVSISTTSPKVDFNNDGQEDILWRYNGSGGYNRAWFLGNPGGAAQPSNILDSQPEAGPAESPIARNETPVRIVKGPPNMGRNADRKKGSPLKDSQDAMGRMNKRDTGLTMIDDPRNAGGVNFKPSPLSIADPRQVKLARSPETGMVTLDQVGSAPAFLGGADVMPVGDMNWQIVGTGDFNNDTHVDILWRNSSSGSNVVWYMNGVTWMGSAVLLGVSDPTWQIVGTGDFNKDGNVDILWRYYGAGGYNIVWYLNGASWTGSAELIPVGDTTWEIAGTGDYNNDGSIDILWRYNGPGGYNYIWYLNGVTWAGGGDLLPVADLTWKIVSR